MAQIVWSATALADLAAMADFIALDKPGAAQKLIARVVARVGNLAAFPLAGGKPPYLRGTRYRVLVVPPVKIFDRANDDTVYVVHVLRGEQSIASRGFE